MHEHKHAQDTLWPRPLYLFSFYRTRYLYYEWQFEFSRVAKCLTLGFLGLWLWFSWNRVTTTDASHRNCSRAGLFSTYFPVQRRSVLLDSCVLCDYVHGAQIVKGWEGSQEFSEFQTKPIKANVSPLTLVLWLMTETDEVLKFYNCLPYIISHKRAYWCKICFFFHISSLLALKTLVIDSWKSTTMTAL